MEYKKYVEILNEKRSITYIITNELIRNRPNRIHHLIILLFLSLPFRLSSLSLPGENFPKIRETTSSSPKQQVCALREMFCLYHRLLSITSLYAPLLYAIVYIYIYIYVCVYIHTCVSTHTYIFTYVYVYRIHVN